LNLSDRALLILLSGGIDSATALALACDQGSSPSALFVDYGQAAAAREARSSASIAAFYGAPYRAISCTGVRFGAGEVRGRNAFLLHLGLMAFEATSGLIALAIHSGTLYRDCGPDFVDLMQRSYDFHTGGEIAVVVPFLGCQKRDVLDLALSLGVPLQLTYSCESGVTPCGTCLSCRDLEALGARCTRSSGW
jgi:7-cyano-7-deazaguanine synthase